MVKILSVWILMGSFCKNNVKFQLKKYRRVSLMTLKNDAAFKEKLTCRFTFKFDMRNLMKFHPNTPKSKNVTSMGCFCPKYMRFELKKYRGVIFHDTGQWWKFWINPDLLVSKMTWGTGWTFIQHSKVWKICTLMGSFCPNHKIFQLVKFAGIMCYETDGWGKN